MALRVRYPDDRPGGSRREGVLGRRRRREVLRHEAHESSEPSDQHARGSAVALAVTAAIAVQEPRGVLRRRSSSRASALMVEHREALVAAIAFAQLQPADTRSAACPRRREPLVAVDGAYRRPRAQRLRHHDILASGEIPTAQQAASDALGRRPAVDEPAVAEDPRENLGPRVRAGPITGGGLVTRSLRATMAWSSKG